MIIMSFTFAVINYQSDTLTSFVLQVIVILRMDCALGSTHRIFWKTSLIGQGVVAQQQVILQDHELITQQEQQKVGTCVSYIFSVFFRYICFQFLPAKCNVCSREDSSTVWSAFGSGFK